MQKYSWILKSCSPRNHMGNRLANPKQRRPRLVPDATSIALRSQNITHAIDDVSLTGVGDQNGGKTFQLIGSEDAGSPLTRPSTWDSVRETVRATDAFEQSSEEEKDLSHQQHEMQVAGKIGSERGPPSLEELSCQYTSALMLMARGDLMSAVTTFRKLAKRPVASPMAADARVRLAQCLLIMDPSLEKNGGEVERVLIECNGVQEQGYALDLEAKELLVHVQLARGNPDGDPEYERKAEHPPSCSIRAGGSEQFTFYEYVEGIHSSSSIQAKRQRLSDFQATANLPLGLTQVEAASLLSGEVH